MSRVKGERKRRKRRGSVGEKREGCVLVATLGVGSLSGELVDALPNVLKLVALGLLRLEPRLDGSELVVDLGYGGLGVLDLLLGDRVLLVASEFRLESVKLDLELETGTLETVDLFRLRLAGDANGGAGLVNGVDGGVGKLASGEVAVGEGGGGHEGRVKDGDTVVDLRGAQESVRERGGKSETKNDAPRTFP